MGTWGPLSLTCLSHTVIDDWKGKKSNYRWTGSGMSEKQHCLFLASVPACGGGGVISHPVIEKYGFWCQTS